MLALQQHKASPLSILQIGANDGIGNDPLFDFFNKEQFWSATLVEPHPLAFSRLHDLYGDDERITLIDKAVGVKRGALTLYFPNKKYEQETGASISKRTRLATCVPSIQQQRITRILGVPGEETWNYIDQETVDVITLRDLVELYSTPRPDIVCIDIEGLDGDVAKAAAEEFAAEIIFFEIWHLSCEDQKSVMSYLNSCGYFVKKDGQKQKDAIAIKF